MESKKMHGGEINKSFFYANDTRYGNGNVSLFTFFSEFNRDSPASGYIEAGFLTTIFVLSIIANSVILVFMIKSKASLTVTNYFVCNLVIGDVAFVMAAPFIAYTRITGNWLLGKTMCNLMNYWMFVCGSVMIWTMTVISIDRYVCINLRTSTKKRLQPRHVGAICLAIWVTTAGLFLPLYIFFHIRTIQIEHGTVTICTMIFPYTRFRVSVLFTCLLVLFGFIIPISLIGFNYFRIFKRFWASKRAVDNSADEVVRRRRSNARRGRDVKIVKTLVLLVIVFLAMWLPLFSVFILIEEDVQYYNNAIPSSTLVWVVFIAFGNSFVNPFMYGFINIEIRRTFRTCCGRFRSVGDISVVMTRSVQDEHLPPTSVPAQTTHM